AFDDGGIRRVDDWDQQFQEARLQLFGPLALLADRRLDLGAAGIGGAQPEALAAELEEAFLPHADGFELGIEGVELLPAFAPRQGVELAAQALEVRLE